MIRILLLQFRTILHSTFCVKPMVTSPEVWILQIAVVGILLYICLT